MKMQFPWWIKAGEPYIKDGRMCFDISVRRWAIPIVFVAQRWPWLASLLSA
jgi:hypothetical protein